MNLPPKNKFNYSTLNNIEGNVDVNFYGIIYDASFPLYQESNNNSNNNNNINNYSQNNWSKYECTIKLIDNTVNCLTFKDQKEFNNNIINLIIKTSDKSQIPYIHCIGDIIRVQKGNYSHKNKRNVYLNFTTNNTNKNLNWCIFCGIQSNNPNDFKPLLCSNKTYLFEKQDEILITNLRKYLKENLILENSLFYPYESKLNKRDFNYENDVLVIIEYKQYLSDQIVYTVRDETDKCDLHTYKYFNFLNIGDVIRLRGFKVLENKNEIIMNQYSNILRIPNEMWYYKNFIEKLTLNNNNNNKNKNNDNNNNNIKFYDNFDNIDNNNNNNIPTKNFLNNALLNYENLKFIENPKNIIIKLNNPTSINDDEISIQNYDDLNPNEDIFILDLNIIDIYPKNNYEKLNVFCLNCKNNYFYEKDLYINDLTFYCPNCKENRECFWYYNILFICIDNIYTNKIFNVHLCTNDSEGEDFFSIKPNELAKDFEKNVKILIKKFEELIKKDTYVRIKIHKYFYKEKFIFKIIGKYTNIV